MARKKKKTRETEAVETEAVETEVVEPEAEEQEPAEPPADELTDEAPPAEIEVAREDEEAETLAPVPAVRSLVRHDPLTAYMQEIRRYPLLTREEEHQLAVKYYETGDLMSARRLVESNLVLFLVRNNFTPL